MKSKAFLTLFLLVLTAFTINALDYGLRVKSHSTPGGERTSLYLGNDSPFHFEKTLKLEFDLAFYETPHFGQIASISLDNGKQISIVSSVNKENRYNPGIVVDGVVSTMQALFIANQENPGKIILSLDKESGQLILNYNGNALIQEIDFGNASDATIVFGRTPNQATSAPVDIKDIQLFLDGRNTNHWNLARHEDDICIDCISGSEAKAVNPTWIIDDHLKWEKILDFKTDKIIQTAFNPSSSLFYILSGNDLRIFNAKTHRGKEYPLPSDNRVMKYSNHLAYDSVSNSLLSYNLKDKKTSRLSLDTFSWDNENGNDAESSFQNHSFTTDGTYAYTFGGYGFYLFNNSAFKINLQTGEVVNLPLHPLPEPRTGSASAIVDGKLYLFGGFGNSMGKQEIPADHFYDLWEYDLKSLQGKKLWEFKQAENNFLLSSSMFFSESENAFYMGATLNGGTMIKIKLDEPGFEVVTEDIHSKMDYRDCVFDLYRDDLGKIYYLVVDKRLDDFSHDYSIYEVTYPFADNEVYGKFAKDSDGLTPGGESDDSKSWIWIICGIILAIIVFSTIIITLRRNGRRVSPLSPATGNERTEPSETSSIVIANNKGDNKTESDPQYESSSESSEKTENKGLSHLERDDLHNEDCISVSHAEEDPTSRSSVPFSAAEESPFNLSSKSEKYFKRDRSAISLLGEFNVRDKEGNDVTANFTSRLKDLIILLCLESERSSKGVRQQLIDELIWNDKDERSVKNNRNVYMRKLRVLLAEIGDIEIVFDKGYYIIKNKDVCVDYIEIQKRLKQLESNEDIDTRTIDETLELLLFGPLLPHTTYQWLDNFKSNYSNASLDMLFKLMKYVKTTNPNDDTLLYKIAETIACHDPLSEEALQIKCRILAKRRMTGLAKKIYERFARDYEESFGEPYKTSFAEILK